MISASRCSTGGGNTRSATMSAAAAAAKDRRVVVNGGGSGAGGYVNRCEQALDDKHEMMLGASGDLLTANGFGLNYEQAKKGFTLCNLKLVDHLKTECTKLKAMLREKEETIKRLSVESETNKKNADKAVKQLVEYQARVKSLDALPFTPVSSTCSSGVGDSSSAELPEQQETKPKRRRIRQPVGKQTNSCPSESNQSKRVRTRSTRTKSGSSNGKMQELSLITADNAYYTCLGNYDPIKDEPIPENNSTNLEIPSWRVKTYTSWYQMEGTENMSDDIFENRHLRFEQTERKRKRWDMQMIRQLRHVEYLKKGRNKHHSQNSNNNDKEELTTLLPDPNNIKAIEITDKIPVSAFGVNLHFKKKYGAFKFYHSKWCNDESQLPQERNVRGLRSSGRNQSHDTI